jgi:hypothetical protein
MTATADRSWCNDPRELAETCAMLLRAGVLTPEQRSYYYDKPWKWSHERRSCRMLELAMHVCGVEPAHGWTMMAKDLAANVANVRASQLPGLDVDHDEPGITRMRVMR